MARGPAQSCVARRRSVFFFFDVNATLDPRTPRRMAYCFKELWLLLCYLHPFYVVLVRRLSVPQCTDCLYTNITSNRYLLFRTEWSMYTRYASGCASLYPPVSSGPCSVHVHSRRRACSARGRRVTPRRIDQPDHDLSYSRSFRC